MDITLYSRATCPFCIRAKALLDKLGKPYTLHELHEGDPELTAAKAKWGHPTVPIVIIDGKLIGGCTELENLAASGGLR
ncbi:MAG: glutaredoxin [Planctomycetota bacterium]|nr:glutaredoxin [Planctomycetota bacterium]